MRVLAYCAGASLFIGLAFVAYWFLVPPIKAALAPPQDIIVSVTLDNRCDIEDDVFIVTVPELGRSARFHSSIARMTLPDNVTVKLAISPLFPNFVYDGLAKPVKEKVTLIAECSQPPRLDSIFGAMKEQFGKKSN
ncbi:hypothetical protein [Candidatus Puniceispirillum sp.]|uniref:hypothetical protein n=1 Tax=Candidatus Puniceispirillum sp. TaxID=2026719 RepID=UPI003F69E2A8